MLQARLLLTIVLFSLSGVAPMGRDSSSPPNEIFKSEESQALEVSEEHFGERPQYYYDPQPMTVLDSSESIATEQSQQVLQGGSSRAGAFVSDNDPISSSDAAYMKHLQGNRTLKLEYKVREMLRKCPHSRKAREIMEKEGWNMEDLETKRRKSSCKVDSHRKNLIVSRITALRNAITEFDLRRELKSTTGYYFRQKKRFTKRPRQVAKSQEQARVFAEADEFMDFVRETMYIFRISASDSRLIERIAAINQWMKENMCPPYKEVRLPNLPCFQVVKLEGSLEALHFTQVHLPVPERGPERDRYVARMFGEDECQDDVSPVEIKEDTDHQQEDPAEIEYDDGDEEEWLGCK